MSQALDDGYRAMAADVEREVEAGKLASDRRFNSQIAEVVNRNDLVTTLLGFGYNVYLPVYDRGVDLIACRDCDATTMRIQLKSRWTIDRKYEGQLIWIAFRHVATWYLAPHDELVKMGYALKYCLTDSWITGGKYTVPRMGTKLRDSMMTWLIGDSHHALVSL